MAKIKVLSTMLIGLGARDYTLSQVISELIDNSIANDAKHIRVAISRDRLEIIDDGSGQDKKGTEEAVNLGKMNEDPKSQSVYGLGIKQLWCWLGDEIMIGTKKEGEPTVHTLTLSMSKIIKKYKYLTNVPIIVKERKSYVIGLEEYCQNENHFWQLKIMGLKNKNWQANKGLMNALSRTFAPYIRRDYIISVNDKPLKKIPEPKFVFKSTFERQDWGMKGFWGIVAKGKGGGAKFYGANTYHNGRMITTSDREILSIGDADRGCKIVEHPSYYRLMCEIYFESPSILDKNKVSNKNNWIKDINYLQVQAYLLETVTKSYMEELRKIQANEEKAKQRLINEAIAKTASPHLKKAFEELKRPHKAYERKAKITGEGELVEVDVRTQGDPTGEHSNMEKEKDEDEARTRQTKLENPHKEKRPHIPIYIGDDAYKLQIISTLDFGEDEPRYYHNKNETDRTLQLFINENRQDIESLDSKQRVPLILEWVVEVLVRIITPSLSSSDFIEEREKRLNMLDAQKWYDEVTTFLRKAKRNRNL